MVGLRIPTATYRVQFHRGFTFGDARSLVGYLHRLGISDLYASPIFKARPGSAHGYDVADPTNLNPELGTGEDFEALVQELKAHGMGLLLDIVPNHVAAGPENPWWVDLLESGPASPFAGFFDVDWSPAGGAIENQLVLPILGKPYHEVLEGGELVLSLDRAGLNILYHDYRLPLEVKSYGVVVSRVSDSLERATGVARATVQSWRRLCEAIHGLTQHHLTGAAEAEARRDDGQRVKKELRGLLDASAVARESLEASLAAFNGTPGDPRSFDALDQLLARQPYKLAFWKTGRELLNYRRFFDIADLAAVRVENPQAFQAGHALALKLAGEGKVTGLRIDHVDGLADPAGYLDRLQRKLKPEGQGAAGFPPFYVLVEKILAGGEDLPEHWPVHGTTGYDFTNALNGLFVDREGFERLVAGYWRMIGSSSSFADVVYENKKRAIRELFGSETDRLGRHLTRLARQDRYACDVPAPELDRVLVEVTACLPVYRTYATDILVSEQDRRRVEAALEDAGVRCPDLEERGLEFLRGLLLGDHPAGTTSEERESRRRFLTRWQQFTGPVTAKGVEDTSMYIFNPLVSLNEVGGEPSPERLSVEAFHRHNALRQSQWPHTMNATSTHDTKRSEDVRARINVLSEMPAEWTRRLNRWRRWNQGKKLELAGQLIPDANAEALLYQTLVGAWPLSPEEAPQFVDRLKEYLIKAAREAKTHTDWISPDLDYEGALAAFAGSILGDSGDNLFLADFLSFQKRVAGHGALNSLAQALLKTASPGAPDFYQGTELWDFSLVDPDNRRPVDFEKRARLLDSLGGREMSGRDPLPGELPGDSPGDSIKDLLHSWQDGRIKLYITCRALSLRREFRELFQQGEYIPLRARGETAEHVCAFARRRGAAWAVIAVPRLSSGLVGANSFPLGRRVWREDSLILPEGAPARWRNAFTGDTVTASPEAHDLPLSAIFERCPVALLTGSDAG